ncbi:hypothetical protein [Roseiconus lacunae]|uniref:Uncharacterized protein n=1 Tax=Roseiconus lacunae TaxID=2605694 RepID=A0ABT7PFK5_9BACT|nr:hypothetical protein [Roseiconus lacunae]MDM4015279.1 hypothetical protein [Roseiconus lacunae]
MTLSIERAWNDVAFTDGVSSGDDELELKFLIRGDDDEDETDLLPFVQNPANIPNGYLGLAKQNVHVDRYEDTDEYWLAVASYAASNVSWTRPKLEVNDVRWWVKGGGGQTVKKKFARRLVSESLPTGATHPTLAGSPLETAMGIDYQDGEPLINGLDVRVGSTQIGVQTVWSHSQAVTDGRVVKVAEYANHGAVNKIAWQGFAAGTLSIEEFEAQYRSGEDPDWDISFTFSFEPNLTNIDAGNGITVPSKKGHQYFDTFYMAGEVSGVVLPVLKRVAVLEDHPEINYAAELLV